MTIHPDTIRDAVSRVGIQKKDLAERAGLHPNTLNGLERDEWNPQWVTLSKLCTAVADIKRERA